MKMVLLAVLTTLEATSKQVQECSVLALHGMFQQMLSIMFFLGKTGLATLAKLPIEVQRRLLKMQSDVATYFVMILPFRAIIHT